MSVTRSGPYHHTRSGRVWYPYDPRPEDVFREDLLALGNVCRFGGHVMPGCWYSNLDHSLRVAELLESWGEPSSVVLEGLAHDLHEVYSPNDQLSPVIRCQSQFATEARVMSRKAASAVRIALGLPEHLSPAVKRADAILLATERRDLMAPSVECEWGPLPDRLPTQIRPYSIAVVETLWRRLWAKHGGTW